MAVLIEFMNILHDFKIVVKSNDDINWKTNQLNGRPKLSVFLEDIPIWKRNKNPRVKICYKIM